jgi:hypothetical protein
MMSLDMTADASRIRRRRRVLIGLLTVGLVVVVLVVGGGVWLYRALPRIAAAEIGRLLNAQVETGAFYPHRDGSVTVVGLVIRPKQELSPYDNTILRAEHVYAKFDRRSLLRLSPRVTAIGVEDFLLDVQLDLDTGRWNIGSLRFNTPRGEGGDMPVIRLVRGKLRYCKISGGEQAVVMSIPAEVQFERDPDGNAGYAFEIKTSKLSGGYGASHLEGRWRPPELAGAGELTLAGGLSSTDIPSLERAWAVDLLAGVLEYGRDGRYSLNLSMKGLHGKYAPEVDMLRFIMPTAVEGPGPVQSLREFFAEYQPTGTVGSIAIKAGGNLKKLQDSVIEGKVVCQDISVCDRDFPYRLDHLTGELEFTQDDMRTKGLVGKHGPVEVRLDAWARGDGDDRQYQYRVTSRNMRLDQALYDALDPNEKRLWDAFRPTGTIGVDYRLARSSPTNKRLYLSVDLNDVTAAFQGLPYPLAGLTGNLFFDDDSVTLTDVVSQAAGRQIRVSGKVTQRSGDEPMYYLSIDAKDIPLDRTLRDALPPRHRELCSRFDVNGLADIRARVFSTDDANDNASPGVGGLPARSARTPVAGLGSTAQFPGRAGSAPSAVAGPVPDARAGLQESRRVSFLAEVSCKKGSLKLLAGTPEPSRQPGGPARSPGEPALPAVRAPLVISDITAEATITPDSLSIRKLEGRHGRSPVALSGGVLFDKGDKLKQCRMEITARQVTLDPATIGLLPPAAARQAAAFHPEGDVNLAVELTQADSNAPPEYAVVMDCLGDKINHERFPYPLQDVRGTVTFAKDSIVLKKITAKPIADSGAQQTVDANPKSEIRDPQSLIQVDGSATVAGGKPGNGSFTVKATNLLFTEGLGRALPEVWAGLYREMSPQGPFDLDLTTLKLSQDAAGEALVEFAGKADLRTCDLKVSGAALGLTGTLESQGSYSATRGFSRGHVRLAAAQLVVKGKTVTHADLEAIYDPNAHKWTAENFVGDCYGGRLLGSLEVSPARPISGTTPGDRRPPSAELSDADRGVKGTSSAKNRGGQTNPPAAGAPARPLEYQLRLALDGVDLQQFLLAGEKTDSGQERELLSSVLRSSSSASSGTMDAALSLCARMGESPKDETRIAATGESGAPRGPDAQRRGVCHIDITNMQVGKVSPMGNVLSVLRLSEPTDYTFERMRIDAYVRADKLLISQLDLSGRSIAFTGSGTMDLPTDEVNLTLTARGARVAAAGPSVLQSLTEGLGGAVVRMEVTGKAGSPRVQTKTLPVIEDSLRILGTPEENKKSKK